jgi:hypothetical protein
LALEYEGGSMDDHVQKTAQEQTHQAAEKACKGLK